VLPLDGVNRHVDFVDALHVKVVEKLVLVEGFFELFADVWVFQEVVRAKIFVGDHGVVFFDIRVDLRLFYILWNARVIAVANETL
jgi:hypothetical protein